MARPNCGFGCVFKRFLKADFQTDFLFSECKLDSYSKKMYCGEKATLPPLNPPTAQPTTVPVTTKPWTISTAPNQCK